MALHDRPRTTASAILIAALLLAACGSDDDGHADGLRDIRDTEPAADDDTSANDEDGDGRRADEPNDDGASAEADEPHDAPSGDPEPVTFDGVTVPDDALQINPDLDMPPEEQLEYLQFALDAFLYTTRALNTGDWDKGTLAAYYVGDELTGITRGLERYTLEGLRQVNDGSRLEFLRIHATQDGATVMHQCTVDGPDDGVVDLASGEYTFEPDDPYWLVEIHLVATADGGGVDGHRINWIGGTPDGVACP